MDNHKINIARAAIDVLKRGWLCACGNQNTCDECMAARRLIDAGLLERDDDPDELKVAMRTADEKLIGDLTRRIMRCNHGSHHGKADRTGPCASCANDAQFLAPLVQP